MVKELFLSTIEDIKFELQKTWYAKWIALVGVIALLSFGGWKIVSLQKIAREKKAQVAFVFALEDYVQLMHGTENPNYKEAEQTFSLVAQKHAGTVYGETAQLFVSDCQGIQGEAAAEIATLEKWLTSHDASYPLYYLYKTRLALLYCDNNRADEGMRLLEKLAADKNNKQSDKAQFFLGYFYWNADDIAQARQAWQPLIDAQKDVVEQGRSPWAALAESKLLYIS